MKRLFTISIAILAEALAVSNAQEYLRSPSDPTLTVCSINMDNNQDTWNTRREHIKTFFIFHMPEIVCAQEITKENLEYFDELPQYRRIEYGSGWGGKSGFFNSIFYDINRLKLEDSGNFWFSQTPNEFSTSWGAKSAQSCSWAKFRDKTTNKLFVVFNLQWFDSTNEMKIQSARLLQKKVREIATALPFVICGDFGAPPDAPFMMGIMQNMLFYDSKKLSKSGSYGPDVTEHDPKGIVDLKIHKRTNYIFCSRGIEVLKHGTMSDGGVDDYLSRKFPIIIQIEVK